MLGFAHHEVTLFGKGENSMSEQDYGSIPPTPSGSTGPSSTESSWGSTQPPYTPPVGAPPPGYTAQPVAASGLSENTACALAYITFIPAIIFLLVPPYNASPRIKFHAIQELGLTVLWMALGIIFVVPILGWIIGALGFLCVLVAWIMCIIKASQGSAFKLPLIGKFAAEQSGYII